MLVTSARGDEQNKNCPSFPVGAPCAGTGCGLSRKHIKCSYVTMSSEKTMKEREGGREASGCGHVQSSGSHSGGLSSQSPCTSSWSSLSPLWGSHSLTRHLLLSGGVGSHRWWDLLLSWDPGVGPHQPHSHKAESRPVLPSDKLWAPLQPSQSTGDPQFKSENNLGFCSFLSLHLFVCPKHLMQKLKQIKTYNK